jgi:ABC-type molybdate transport system substrate-binding protein
MVLLRNASETARLFYQFMQDEKAKRVLRQHGFDVPGSS